LGHSGLPDAALTVKVKRGQSQTCLSSAEREQLVRSEFFGDFFVSSPRYFMNLTACQITYDLSYIIDKKVTGSQGQRSSSRLFTRYLINIHFKN